MATRGYGYQEYVQGSTVRKLSAVPEKRPQRQQPQRQQPLRPVKKERIEHEAHSFQSLDLISLLCMTAAIAITFYFCISYIEVQHNITTMSKQIAIAESTLNELKEQNDAAYNKIDTSIDLDYVYRVAVGELGMVPADKTQIVPYDNVKSDYVRQYGEIPKPKENPLQRAISGSAD